MKTIEVDEELYLYIASQTQHIGESASDILRRLLMEPTTQEPKKAAILPPVVNSQTPEPKGIVVSKDAGMEIQLDRVKEVRSLLISDEFAAQDKAIGRFMTVLSSLYRIDPQGFSEATALKGRTRVYFANDADTLLASGKTTKPKAIPNTPFWVITNTNTGRKRQMIDQLMIKMGFNSDLIEKVCGAI
ncbi:replication initiation negative regulator SeqA [Vibrio sp. Of7-15]|uniref:replication initiation negative regulator SeqA n=1 Tax=Vibrio sp. Of7-15 TaxID=2724879 RepID=UPI001EF28F31|nr:replication initiation negative regulator SeqA [Vibrio sp. Of7-15]MCG7495776.1 replication initiation negative regulator SeqA [Vibrio sp. Of7-15]